MLKHPEHMLFDLDSTLLNTYGRQEGEGKSGFDFSSASSHSKIVNANLLLVHAMAYNLFSWFRRLALAANMIKRKVDTIRLKMLKVAAKAVHSARYTILNFAAAGIPQR